MLFSACDVRLVDQLVVDGRHRVLPQLRLGDPRSEVAADRSHVAVQQLVPRLGERLVQLLGVVEPAPGDLAVDRRDPHRDVGDQHRRLASRPAERIGNGRLGVLGLELPGTGGALRQLPLVAVQDLQVAVAPLRRRGRPHDLEAAGDGVAGLAGAERALPAQPLLLDRGTLRLGPDAIVRTRAVGLAEGVAADDQRGGLLVVHRHPAERLADVDGGGQRIRLAFRAFGIHVDQAHRGGAVAFLELPRGGISARIALVGTEPFVFLTEEDLFRLPEVGTAEGEAERLEARRLQRRVAGEHQQVGPGDLVAVLLLDRPQQPARLVQVGVVRPAVERGEALHALPGATAAVEDAVGAGGVPAQPDEQAAVAAVVGGPPVLRGGDHRDHVGLERLDVELGELRGVVEVLAERIALASSAGAASTRRSGWATSPGSSAERLPWAWANRLPDSRFRYAVVSMTQHSFQGWVNRAVITGVIGKLALPNSRGTGPSR